jgi:hypothetical protein
MLLKKPRCSCLRMSSANQRSARSSYDPAVGLKRIFQPLPDTGEQQNGAA